MSSSSMFRAFNCVLLIASLAGADVQAQESGLPGATTRGAQAEKEKGNSFQIAMSRDAHFSDTGKKVNDGWNQLIHLVMDDTSAALDPRQQPQILAKIAPVAKQLRADAHQLAIEQGNAKTELAVVETIDEKVTEYLVLLGDPETMATLQGDVAGADVEKAMKAQKALLNRDWTLAGGDQEKRRQVVEVLEKLAHEHPDNRELAAAIFDMHNKSNQNDIRDQLMGLLAEVMKPDAAGKYAIPIKIYNASKAMRAQVGKPFVLEGKTSDGKDFTTADWKGKVVLVDFWATWCPPCVAELPKIRKLYADLHDKGFEIVGVSNDFSAEALQKFTTEKQIDWPQLFDSDAAAKRDWNPITLAHGINGIPRLYVIDRDGVLITQNAGAGFEQLVTKALGQ